MNRGRGGGRWPPCLRRCAARRLAVAARPCRSSRSIRSGRSRCPTTGCSARSAASPSTRSDHVWILQRPRTLTDDEKGATLKPPRNKCCAPAPSVMEFDADGNFVQGWGGPRRPSRGSTNEHGIHVDRKGFVWIAGNADNDSAIFKFTPATASSCCRSARLGADRRQQRHHPARPAGRHRGRRRAPTRSTSPTATATAASSCSTPRPAPTSATGAPTARSRTTTSSRAYDPGRAGRRSSSAIRCIAPSSSHDGLVYVCDRTNNRIQVFKKDGTFVTEWFYDKPTLGNGAVWDLRFLARRQPDLSAEHRRREQPSCASCAAPTAAWSAASAAPAARPASSTGCTTSPSTPRATSIPARSTTGSACRSSSRPTARRNSQVGSQTVSCDTERRSSGDQQPLPSAVRRRACRSTSAAGRRSRDARPG